MSIYSRENGFSSYYSNVGREKKEKKEKKKNCFHCISESTQIMWMIMGTRYVYRMIIYSWENYCSSYFENLKKKKRKNEKKKNKLRYLEN